MFPPLSDGVPHFVQAVVEFLDHVPVAVPNVGRPRQQEIIRWFPHGLKSQRKKGGDFSRELGLVQTRAFLLDSQYVDYRMDRTFIRTPNNGNTFLQPFR